jgi:16S rRNA processing protein RimM
LSNSQTTKRLLVGKINGLFGIKGFIKIFSYTDPKEQITGYKKLLIKTGDNFEEVKASSKKQGKTIVASIDGIDNTDLAEKLLGKELYIDTQWLPKLDGEYYHYQLENLQVFNTLGDDLGKVAYLFDNGGNTVLASKIGKKERLIPFIEPYLISVDLEEGKIIVDWDKDF